MSWILLATAGQFLNAIVAILDKYIVSDTRILPRPFVYAFYSCLITGFWIVIFFVGLIPGLSGLGVPSLENVHPPTIQVVGMSFLAAYTFFMALVSMYDALKHADASNVMPIIGAVSALASFGMTYLFLDQSLSANFVWGVILLATGTALVANNLPHLSEILHVIHSGIFFALHYITMKGLFLETNFDDGFFWSRVGFVLFTLSLLLVPAYLDKIREQTASTSRQAGALVIFTKLLAGVAAFLLLKATDFGEVAVVQALEALRFIFILIFAALLARWLPENAVEKDLTPKEIVRRVLYVTVIAVGFFILFT
jgi:drug/metabolite transporter (DMT)-like permease